VDDLKASLLISSVLQTCAHRYEKRQYVNTVQETRDIIGRCYVLSQDLTIKDDMDNGVWSFCDGRLRGHEKFGSCQQGVAATFTRDYHYIVFGAPGTYNWKGTTWLPSCLPFPLALRWLTRVASQVQMVFFLFLRGVGIIGI